MVQVSVLLSAKYSTALGPNFTASFIPGQEASGPAILEGFQTAEKRNILPKLPLGMLNLYFVRCIFLAQNYFTIFTTRNVCRVLFLMRGSFLLKKTSKTEVLQMPSAIEVKLFQWNFIFQNLAIKSGIF